MTRRLQQVDDEDAYFRDPEWKILRRRGYFCSSPRRDLLTLWGVGHADSEGVQELFRLFAAVERAGYPKHKQLVVLRHLDSVSFAAMHQFIHYHRQVSAYLASVTREAVVRPEGLVGVLAEGFYRTVNYPADGRVFTDLGAACAFVGLEDAEWLACAEAEERAELLRMQQSVRSLQPLFAQGLMRVTLGDAARHLGVPTRTLQRRFADAGESFAEARLRAVLEHAEGRLLTGADVKVIAYECGFRSVSAFIAAFRRARGLPPQEWRQRAIKES